MFGHFRHLQTEIFHVKKKSRKNILFRKSYEQNKLFFPKILGLKKIQNVELFRSKPQKPCPDATYNYGGMLAFVFVYGLTIRRARINDLY